MNLAERVLTVPEAAALLRISTRSYYAAAARGEVPARHIGRRIVVPGAQLARFLGGEVSPTTAMRGPPKHDNAPD
jgi:excisionase family DNA binding protein